MINYIKKIIDRFGFPIIFLWFSIVVVIIIFVFNFLLWLSILKTFYKNLIQIIPILILVYFIIFIFNLIIDNDKLKLILEKKNYFFKLILSIFIGIISSGPVYIWYPLLKKIKENSLTYWQIASFIYARAIKIPMFPIMITYFWIKYTIVFNSTILIFSVFIWLIIDFLYINILLQWKK